MSWQRITVSTGANVGAPGELPPQLVGLDDATLANLPAALAAATLEQLGLQDTGFHRVPDPQTLPARTLSRIDFLRRFTDTETAAIATSTDAHATAFRFKLLMISAVELDAADTVAAVNYLETGISPGLIASGRAAQILA